VREYDQIADWYVDSRSPEVGVPDLVAFAKLFPHPAKVLDVGCGHGVPVSQFLLQRGFHLYGLDSSAEMIARYRINFPRVPTRCEPVQDAHFDEASFDAVVAWGVLFHLGESDQETVIRRVSAWLEPGGWFLFTSGPAAGERVGEMGGIEFRYRSLGVDRHREVLEEAGMRLHDHHSDEWDNHVYLARKGRDDDSASPETPGKLEGRPAEPILGGGRSAAFDQRVPVH
jgi:SAM-dependent methyltransferase